MFPQQVQGYLRKFFQENNCTIVNDQDDHIIVQLTVDMDKRIMNRPYYWKYLEASNGEPNPAQLIFITDQNKLEEDVKGEVVHFGSPRLNQLFQVTKELGAYVQMFERVDSLATKATLTPWLGVNYKVSYSCNRTKEMLYSFGINLMTGHMIEGFQEHLSSVDLVSVMSEDTFCLPYIIKPIRALERLDIEIEKIVQQDDHTWADEAKIRWQKDQEVLEHFYEGVENRPECYEMEKQALEEQYAAGIKIDIVNGGVFYLK